MVAQNVLHMDMVTSCVLVLVMLTQAMASDSCDQSPGDALYLDAKGCLTIDNFLEKFTDLFHISFWERLCNQSAELEQCLRKQFETCGDQYVTAVIQAAMDDVHSLVDFWLPSVDTLFRMINEGCQGAEIRNGIQKLYRRANNLNCMDQLTRSDITDCIITWLDEMSDIRASGNSSSTITNERRESLIRFGRSSFQCARNLVRANCSEWAQDLLLYVINATVPTALKPSFSKAQVDIPLNQTYIMSTQRSTVGVYGAQHILVFTLNTPITCLVSGHVTYLSNQLFRVTGYSKVTNNIASVLNRLEIVFFRPGGGEIGRYVTQGDKLVTTFDFGDLELSPYHNPVEIISIDPGVKIQINSTSRAYIMLIQKQIRGFLFSIRIGEGVLKTSSGVLVSGCSYNNIINLRPMPVLEAGDPCLTACQDVQAITDDFTTDLTDTCIFDCINTGDVGSAKAFLGDLLESRDYDYGLSLVEPPPTPAGHQDTSECTPGHATPYLYVLATVFVFCVILC